MSVGNNENWKLMRKVDFEKVQKVSVTLSHGGGHAGVRAGGCGCSQGMGDGDRRAHVCQAQAVKAMLARRALLTFSGGFCRWLVLLVLTILVLLGLRTSTPLLDRYSRTELQHFFSHPPPRQVHSS